MKQCKHCGAIQNDTRTVCVDCGAKLDAALTGEEAAAERERINKAIKKLADKADAASDGTYVKLHDKILGTISAICLAFLIVVILGSKFLSDPLARRFQDASGPAKFGALFLFGAVVFFLFPKILRMFPNRSFLEKDMTIMLIRSLFKYFFFVLGMFGFLFAFV